MKDVMTAGNKQKIQARELLYYFYILCEFKFISKEKFKNSGQYKSTICRL